MPPDVIGESRRAVLSDRYMQLDGEAFMTGVQALVRLPMDQRRADIATGLNTAGFISGYPGSPLAGYDLELERRRRLLEVLRIVHRPGLNEESAATAVAGSQLAVLQPDHTVDGVFALWYGKSPGLDRAGDAIRHGNLMGTGTRGGVLVCVGDDPAAKSSSVPSTSEPTLYGLGLPILSPADPQEILDFGRHGFALSRASGLWVGLRISASVADASQTVAVGPDRIQPVMPALEVAGAPFVHQVSAQLLGAKLIELERSLYGPRLEMARRYAADNRLDRITWRGTNDVLGIAAAGPAYLSVLHALRHIGLEEQDLADAGVRLLKIAMPYPLGEDIVREFATGLREIVVVEDKRGFLEMLVKDALYGLPGAPIVVGKRDGQGRELIASTGEVDADAVAEVLAERLLGHRQVAVVSRWLSRARPTLTEPLSLVRGAYFCSGCPHNTSVRVPAGASVGSGSGCHGLAIQMDPRQVGTVVGRLQMGGEGAMWNGMEPFVSDEHFFQNIGDGTFAHSGSLAVRAAVASGVNITYKLLVNSTVAMTGGQPITGGRHVADLARLLLAEGVSKIIITTDDRRSHRYSDLPAGVEVWDRDRIVAAQELLAATPGVTVLIHDQECAAELRRKRSRGLLAEPVPRVYVNPLVCDGCGDCGARSNCLSVRPVDTDLGQKTAIHQESCNADYSCLDGDCPAFLTVMPGNRPRRPTGPPVLDSDRLPAPTRRVEDQHFTMRIAGIGGTGVVTTAQIVAMAAHLQGRYLRGLDQTGIAQKGGSVVSDLRIGREPGVEPHRLGAGECDLYLGCDLLVAAEPRNLVASSADRTVAVMSTARIPTGRQVADPTIPFPSFETLRGRVTDRTREREDIWLDASDLSRRLFGSDVHANVLLLGAAYQHGAVPLDADAIEAAIRLNGVAADLNIQAFRYGRLALADPPALSIASSPSTGAPSAMPDPAVTTLLGVVGATPGSELDRIVRVRIPDLVGYQDHAYARGYAELVGRSRRVEADRCGVPDGPFAQAVAVQLHRLMAYKDEYEVARLHLNPAVRSDIEGQFGLGARIRFHLHPPLLRAVGLNRKLGVGRGANLTFHVLHGMRRLRGSAFDPCGHTRLRRLERDLRDEYRAIVEGLTEELDPDTYTRAMEMAGLPDMIRGYGTIKMANAQRYQHRLATLHGRV